MSVTANRERGVTVEDVVCDRWPFEPAAPAADKRGLWYDLRATAAITTDLGGEIVEVDARIEVKSCWSCYGDRNGRWCIRKTNHEMLVDAEGWYVLVVLDQETGDALRMGLTSAATVDEIIDGNWWDAGDGGRGHDWFRQLPWSTVFDSLEDLRGDSA